MIRFINPMQADVTTNPRPIVLIIDDEPGIAEMLCYALSTDGFEAVWSATGEAGLMELESKPVQLILLDIGLPDINGRDLFRQIQQRFAIPVIFLTARSDEIDRVIGLELGADDYIAKPFWPREVVARVRAVLRRTQKGPTISTAPANSSLSLDAARRRVVYYGQVVELSRYEFGLIKVMADHPGRIFSRDELLQMIWDDPASCYDRTVDTHIKTLRTKLIQIKPDLDPIVTHRGLGYAFVEQLPPSC
ncbi:two-component system response regulator CreB [Chitinivorax sp. B]|uniref:two-component system response regulator CreB n=1 Tax=Chitinivorax sp. B TaxID=2502235 RepID=UPI0032D58D3F